MPVTEGDGTISATAGRLHAAAVLLRSIDVVRELVIDGHVVDLRRRLVVPGTPCLASIHAHADTLVASEHHALRVSGIDPQRVIVIAAGRAFDCLKCLAAVLGSID